MHESIMVVPTPKSGILIKTYERTVNIVQLYNLAKLRKWKNKYTIQFVKVESPLHNSIWQAPPIWTPPLLPFQMKKMPIPLKKIFENQKVPLHSLGGEDTMLLHFLSFITVIITVSIIHNRHYYSFYHS